MRKTPLFVVVTGWSVILAFCPSGAAPTGSGAQRSKAVAAGKQPAGSTSAGADSAAAPVAPAGKQPTNSAGNRQAGPKKTVTGGSARKAQPPSAQKRGVVLVPPPPPAIPAGGQLTFLAGTPVDFLSESDLKRHKVQLDVNLARARQQADEQERLLKEKVQRAELFESLYKEGVVSRRELENSQREVGRTQGDLTDARLKVTDLERDMQRIDARLKQVASRQAPPKQASRGKK